MREGRREGEEGEKGEEGEGEEGGGGGGGRGMRSWIEDDFHSLQWIISWGKCKKRGNSHMVSF